MIAQSTAIAKSEELVDAVEELQGYVLEAAEKGTAAHELEKGVLQRVLKIGRYAVGQFLEMQGSGDLGETVALSEDKTVKRLPGLHVRPYVTIFGGFEIKRTVYGSREGQEIEFVPLDTRLSLPEGKFSYLLQDWDQMIATEEPYNKVSAFLERILGLRQHVDSLERMSRQMVEDAESFSWSRPAPAGEEEGEILVETADGKGVPIRRAADAPPIHDHQHKCGPRPDRKKMATLGAVYTVDRFHRTAEEVVESLFRLPGEDRPKSHRPEPCHKHVYARLTCESEEGETLDSQAVVFGWMDAQVQARDPEGVKEKVCVMDGQESLWDTKDVFQDGVPTTDVLDLLHVTPRLWKAAQTFHAVGSREAEKFVRNRVLSVLRGQVASVIRGFRRLASTRRLSGSRREDIERICRYFEKNRDRMRYDVYLTKGYPIASGVIEGACRHLVKDRLERSGMSWTKPGAQAMLHLRAIYTNAEWDDFIKYRIQQDTQRLHPHRTVVDQVEWPLAA